MPRPAKKLSYIEEDILLDYIVAHGGSYRLYLLFCEETGVKEDRRYTEATYRNWQARRRDRILQKREEQKRILREGSLLDRKNRLQMLEADVARIEMALADRAHQEIVDPLVDIRLMEQKRKLLESISRERGEFGVKPEDGEAEELRQQNRALGKVFMDHFAKEKT